MFQQKIIMLTFIFKYFICQATIIQTDPNSSPELSQAQLAEYYRQAQLGTRETGTNPLAPKMITAEEYMSGKVTLPKEVLQNFQIKSQGMDSNALPMDKELIQVRLQRALNIIHEKEQQRELGIVEQLRKQRENKILQKQFDQLYEEQRQKNIQAGFWSSKFVLPVDTNSIVLAQMITKYKNKIQKQDFKPKTEDDVKSYYRQQYQEVFKSLLPELYQLNAPKQEEPQKPSPLIQYNSRAFDPDAIQDIQKNRISQAIQQRAGSTENGQMYLQGQQPYQAQQNTDVNQNDYLGGPAYTFTPEQSQPKTSNQFTQQVQKIREKEQLQNLKGAILQNTWSSYNPYNQ